MDLLHADNVKSMFWSHFMCN